MPSNQKTGLSNQKTGPSPNPKTRKTYHLCLSSKEEVMFRSHEDFNRAYNYYALALHKTGSTGLADCFMSNHLHVVVQTSDPDKLMYAFRNSYARYFNYKYHRTGRLGDKKHFCIELDGLYHILAAISYTLRNPVHHGVTSTPFEYPHSAANSIFREALGKNAKLNLLHKRNYHRFIGKQTIIPEHFMMSNNGTFLRRCTMDIQMVENFFTTPRAFNFYMTRKSGSEWIKEQENDNNNKPSITLEMIEEWTGAKEWTSAKDSLASQSRESSISRMLKNEYGRNDYRKITDIDLCSKIDNLITTFLKKPSIKKPSIYTLTLDEKEFIAKIITRDHHITTNQLCRCLAMRQI